MSVHVESWAWKQKCGSPLRKLILVKLAQNADDDGWSWWRQGRMAEECETSRSTIQSHLRELRGKGLIQIYEQKREDGGRGANRYRVMGPWVEATPVQDSGTPARDSGIPPAREAGTPPPGKRAPRTVREEPSEVQDLAAGAAKEPEQIGPGRWRVFSRPGRGPFEVDLGRGTCTCENRSSTPCRHMRVAAEAEEHAGTVRKRELRDALWDALVEVYGPVPSKGKTDRGAIVTDLAEFLAAEHETISPTPEAWAQEVRDRYEALAKDWGVGKATIHSLHKNWAVAGKLAASMRPKDRRGRGKYSQHAETV